MATINPNQALQTPVHQCSQHGKVRVQSQALMDDMAARYGFDKDVMWGRDRTASVAFARQIVMTLLYWHTDMSLVEIGKDIGNRDHGTVLWARKKVLAAYQTDARVADFIHSLEATHFGVTDFAAVDRQCLKKRKGSPLPMAYFSKEGGTK